MKYKGATLLEITIASAILMMIGTALLLMFSSAMREYTLKSQMSETLKNNFIGLDKISQEIALAEGIYCPTPGAYAVMTSSGARPEDGYEPADITKCVAFNIKDGATNKVVGYYLDRQAEEIKKVIFDAAATENPATWTVANPSRQITKIAGAKDVDRFSYNKVTFKFDRGYLQNHPVDVYKTQIMILGIVMNRKCGGTSPGFYPLTTKVFLDRNKEITH